MIERAVQELSARAQSLRTGRLKVTTLPPPDSFDDHTLTEYVEFVLLVRKKAISVSLNLLASFPPVNGQAVRRWASSDQRSHVVRTYFLISTLTEGMRQVSTGSLESASRIYDFLLLLSLESAPYRREKRFNEANKIFDLLVREAIKARLTPRGEAVRFGTPVQDDRPQLFEEAIPWLAARMGVAQLSKDLPVDDNDAGVDVVGWQPFGSGRSGFPVWLIQNTLQLSFESKALQIPVELWKQMIAIGPSPDTALAVPFSVPDGDDRWMKVSLAVNSLLRPHPTLRDARLRRFERLPRERRTIGVHRLSETGQVAHGVRAG